MTKQLMAIMLLFFILLPVVFSVEVTNIKCENGVLNKENLTCMNCEIGFGYVNGTCQPTNTRTTNSTVLDTVFDDVIDKGTSLLPTYPALGSLFIILLMGLVIWQFLKFIRVV